MKFLPARLVPYVFSGTPTPTESYDILSYSASSLIAPFELAINEVNNSLLLNSNGEIYEFFASGSTITYAPTTGATGSYVMLSGDTMTGDLILNSSNIYLDNSQGILLGDSGTSIGGHIRLIDNGRIQISAATQVEMFSDLNLTGNLELVGTQLEFQNGSYVSSLSPSSLSTGRTWSLPDNSGEVLVVPSSASSQNDIIVYSGGTPVWANSVDLNSVSADTFYSASTTMEQAIRNLILSYTLETESVQLANFTASAGKMYPVRTASGAISVTPPASPNIGDRFGVCDAQRSFDSFACAVRFNSSGQKFGGDATATANLSLATKDQTATFEYINSIYGWVLVAGTL